MMDRSVLSPLNVTRGQREPWLYLAPAIIWFLIFTIFPLIYTIDLSLRAYAQPAQPYIGLSNYVEMLTDNDLRMALQVTAVYAFVTLGLSFLLGFGIALALASKDLPAASFFRSVIILPYLTTPIVIGLMWRFMMHPVLGIVNYVLGTKGTDWLGSPHLALYSVIAIGTWQLTPFFLLILLAGLLALPPEPFEAAQIDGAGPWASFVNLTLPLMRPVIQVVLLMGVIDIFKVFAIVFASTEGGPARLTEVIGLYIWKTGFRYYRMDYAAALAVVLVIFIAVMAYYTMRTLAVRRD